MLTNTEKKTHQLIGEEENRFERELSVAEVEEILERRAEEIKDHGVIIALCAEPSHKGYTDATRESLVDLGLIFELRMLRLYWLELDGDFLARDDVDPEIDVTYSKGTWEIC
jgi:hypothetical protein